MMPRLRWAQLLLLTAGVALGQPAVISPEVHADGRITFRLAAPAARTVSVAGEAVPGEVRMERDARGVWSFTTGPREPDLYVYSFVVDGVRLPDPRNPRLKTGWLSVESQVHVPGPSTLPWELNDVPRGRITRHPYRSAVGGDDREFLVYTPPGYDARDDRRYPVLYLLHGYSDDVTGWISVGLAHVILDNLIARAEAEPMIVVLPLGYGTMEVIRLGWAGIRHPDGSRPDAWWRNLELFRAALLEEVLPQVEASYRVRTDRAHRAIAGLSMGGAQSLFVGLNAPERFSHVAAFSAGGLREDYATAYGALANLPPDELPWLWIGCGVDDDRLGHSRGLHEWLQEQQIPHHYVETPGGHNYRVWRRYLAQVLPQLFQPDSR
jgi:enterochelin esterase-like enzyme